MVKTAFFHFREVTLQSIFWPLPKPKDGEVLKVVDDPLQSKLPPAFETVGAPGVEEVLIVITLLAPLVPQLLAANT